jgi:hypothetical protein
VTFLAKKECLLSTPEHICDFAWRSIRWRLGALGRAAMLPVKRPSEAPAFLEPRREVWQKDSATNARNYVGYATHCLQLAKATADQNSRAILREMAVEWLRLAELAEFET